jgi:hypothetical protein
MAYSTARTSSIRCFLFVALGSLFSIGSADVMAQAADTIVRLAGAPRYPGVAVLVPELKIGAASGSEEYLVGEPSEILQQRDGSVIVLDWSGGLLGAPMVRRYDANGKFLRKIWDGRTSQLEYGRISGLAELPDGRVLISDIRHNRIVVYSATGESMGAWPHAAYPYPLRATQRLRVGPDGTVYLMFVTGNPPREAGEPAIARLRPDGTLIDVLKPPVLPGSNPPRLTAVDEVRRARCTFTVRYWPRALWTLNRTGEFITATQDRYAIDVRSGNRVTSIRRNVAVVPISPEERAEQRTYTLEALRACGTFDGEVPEVPATKPFIKFIQVHADGRIWAGLFTPSERFDPPVRAVSSTVQPLRWREPTLFDVFEPDGSYVGQVAVPHEIRLLDVRGNTAWGTTRENNVQLVVRYRIEWK